MMEVWREDDGGGDLPYHAPADPNAEAKEREMFGDGGDGGGRVIDAMRFDISSSGSAFDRLPRVARALSRRPDCFVGGFNFISSCH